MKKKHIPEINQHIKDGLRDWSNICLMADADNWSCDLDYDANDVFSVSQLFIHVCMNVGIKKGRIGEKAAQVYGEYLRELVMSMTGYDTWHILDEAKKEVRHGQ